MLAVAVPATVGESEPRFAEARRRSRGGGARTSSLRRGRLTILRQRVANWSVALARESVFASWDTLASSTHALEPPRDSCQR